MRFHISHLRLDPGPQKNTWCQSKGMENENKTRHHSPMQLTELELTNFLCFDSLKLEPGRRKINVFVGRNGRGKSAIRDDLAFLLVG